MRAAGDKEGVGKGSKGNVDGNKVVRQGMTIATKRVMATLMRVSGKEESKSGKDDGNNSKMVGDKEGDGKGGKSNGDGSEDGLQATGTIEMAMATTRAMAMVTRWQATKRATARVATARVARAMTMAMRIGGNEESNGKGGKSNGDGNEGGGQQIGQWQGWQGQ